MCVELFGGENIDFIFNRTYSLHSSTEKIMFELNVFYRLACALALGFLVGLQREHSFHESTDHHPAGVRTFAITGIAGAIAGLISELMDSPAPFVAILLVIGLLLGISHYTAFKETTIENQPGLTTSIAMLMMYLLGALCWYNHIMEATAITVSLLWLLTVKKQLHDFAKKISSDDLIATIKFALISAVILPILPHQAYGPPGLEVLSPYKIWLFVVFISGISFVGYVLVKIIGPGKGIGLTGLLGGLASSTALTWSLTQRSKDNPEYSSNLSMGIIIAWSVMYIRVYVICIIISPTFLKPLFLPLLIPPIPGLLYAFYANRKEAKLHPKQTTGYTNPFELMPAIKFGVIFAAVLFIANAVKLYLGDDALLVSSFVAGFADMDAIALSALEMAGKGTVIMPQACMAIILAGIGNTVCKASLVIIFGAPAMRKSIIPAFLLIIATAIALLLFLF